MFSFLLIPLIFTYVVHKRFNRPKIEIIVNKTNKNHFRICIDYNESCQVILKEIKEDVQLNIHKFDIIDDVKTKTITINIYDKSLKYLQNNSENIKYCIIPL
jgi:hypothetical protein